MSVGNTQFKLFVSINWLCLFLQAASVLVYRLANGGQLPKYLTSLHYLVEQYLPIIKDEWHEFKIRQGFKDVCIGVQNSLFYIRSTTKSSLLLHLVIG